MSVPPQKRANSNPRHLHLVPAKGDERPISETTEPLDLDSLYRKYSKLVASVALRILGRYDEAEEVVQDVFVEAWKWIERIETPQAVKYWLMTVTVRIARRRLRRRRLFGWLGTSAAVSYDTVAGENASPSERTLLAEIYKALDAIPADMRIAWTLRVVQGESIADVASIVGCSLATAKRRVAFASEALEKVVNHER